MTANFLSQAGKSSFGQSTQTQNGSYGSNCPDCYDNMPYSQWKAKDDARKPQEGCETTEGGVGSAEDESLVTAEKTKPVAEDETTRKDVLPEIAEREVSSAEAKTADTGLSTDAIDPAGTTDTGKPNPQGFLHSLGENIC